MNKLCKLALLGLVGLGLTASSSNAALFDYSYVFGDGTHVTGTLDGTPNGNFVDNVNNLTVFFNGTPISGTVFTAERTSSGTWINGAVVSTDVTQNNFTFGNSDVANGGNFGANTEYFFIVNASVYLDLARCNMPTLGIFSNEGSVQTSWSLTPHTNGVPDGGLTIAMLGAAMTGLSLLRRKL